MLTYANIKYSILFHSTFNCQHPEVTGDQQELFRVTDKAVKAPTFFPSSGGVSIFFSPRS